MRSHFQREEAGTDGTGDEDRPYMLGLEASLAGLDDLRFAYIVLPWTLSVAARRAVDGGDGLDR